MSGLIFLSIYPAYLIASFFIKNDPGPREPRREIFVAVSFGALSVALAIAFSLVASKLLGQDASGGTIPAASGVGVIVSIFVYASIEELTKFVPIAVYLRKKPFFNEHTDGIIYFATVGLVFGAIENFLYGLSANELGATLVLSRLIIALFFHGALTSIAGYFYAKAHVRGTSLFMPMAVLFGVSVAHTLYNFFAFGAASNIAYLFGAAAVAVVANCVMFWLYLTASTQDISMGLAGQQPSVQVAQPMPSPVAVQASVPIARIANPEASIQPPKLDG